MNDKKRNKPSIVIIKGIAASLVMNPKIIKTEQRSSAKTTNTKEIADPSPRKFINSILSFAINFSNLGKAWVSIDIPTKSRITNINPFKTLSFTFVELKYLNIKI